MVNRINSDNFLFIPGLFLQFLMEFKKVDYNCNFAGKIFISPETSMLLNGFFEAAKQKETK